MPITQSAKKALRQNITRRARNATQNRAMKDAVKAFKKAPGEAGLASVMQLLDKAAKQNIIPKNKASRLKSRLAHLVGGKKK